MSGRYVAGIYRDPDTGRGRWAVLGPSCVWYFARRYGRTAARSLCRRLNREAA